MVQNFLVCLLILGAVIVPSPAKQEECPKEDDPANPILFPDPADCGSFFECAQGNLVRLTCYPGLYYNVEIQSCDYRSNVDCGSRPTSTPAPVTTAATTTAATTTAATTTDATTPTPQPPTPQPPTPQPPTPQPPTPQPPTPQPPPPPPSR